ncbi:MORN repeat-containing protein [Streptococcus caprae]|uniref:MORN repeat-containing protein n=1 Tax=Streptococcus caprae TaxID=1640501 RepID=A0ABV8CU28_9STRE
MEKLKELTRKDWERIALLIIVLFGLSVLLVPIRSKGTLTYQDGALTYTGSIANHRMNGKGKLTYANGDVYEGNFKNGVFSGKGTFTSANGWSYTGDFKNGQADGQGTLKAIDGKVYKGKFVQGIYQK